MEFTKNFIPLYQCANVCQCWKDFTMSLGNVKVALHDHEGALEDFNSAHEFDPCDVGILKARGNVKVTLHDHQGALEDFDKAHVLDPCDVGILKSRGNVKVTLHDHQGALEDFDRAHELDPCDVEILESQRNVKVALHDHQGVSEDFDLAHTLELVEIHKLQHWRTNVHDHQRALEDFDSALELSALEDFDRALELSPCDEGILKLQDWRTHEGAIEDYFNSAHEFDPCDVGILKARGNVRVTLHDHQGALEDFDKAHVLDPCDVGILRSRANVKVTLHDHQGALEDLNRVLELGPFDVEILRLRGHVKRMMGDLKGSIIDWAMVHGLPYDDMISFADRPFVKRRLENYNGVVGKLNPKQEFDFLMSVKKLVLQLVVYPIVIVIFVFQYLMGYVERGQWGTYSNGTWEFCATYVCIELRLGSYPFQKFRERPPSRRYIGTHPRKRVGKNGEYTMYEPRFTVNKVRFHFPECKTHVKAAFIYDIAKLCFGVKGGKFNMLCPQRYDHLPKISIEGLKEITRGISDIVCKCAESTFQSIKDHPTDGDNQKILKLFEDEGEAYAMNEGRASLDSNGGDHHATPFNAIEALLNSPNDGDVPTIDIDKHAQNLGESTGKHNMIYKPIIF
jgi:tetratricopeptide (TPR) repeat protein